MEAFVGSMMELMEDFFGSMMKVMEAFVGSTMELKEYVVQLLLVHLLVTLERWNCFNFVHARPIRQNSVSSNTESHFGVRKSLGRYF